MVEQVEQKVSAKICKLYGSGCGSVARAVASNTRDPWFEPCLSQIFIYQFIDQLYYRIDENKEKEAGKGPSLKKTRFANSGY